MSHRIVRREEFEIAGEKVIYELEDGSYEDEYGSLKPDCAAYIIKNGVRTRLTTGSYYHSLSRAEGCFPHETKKCPCCGHVSTNRVYGKPLKIEDWEQR